VKPEVTLFDLPHSHTGMIVAAGLKSCGDLHCGVKISKFVPGTCA
jgi:hypothetical protein